MKMPLCKNCNHRIRSLTVYDHLQRKGLYIHSKHPYSAVTCFVKDCYCNKPEPIEEI